MSGDQNDKGPPNDNGNGGKPGSIKESGAKMAGAAADLAKSRAQDIGLQIQRAALRAFVGGFRKDTLTDGERAKLESAGVSEPLVQNYAAWRKALLWGSGIMLTIGLLLSLANYKDFETQYREGLRASFETAMEQQREAMADGGQTQQYRQQLNQLEQTSEQYDQQIQYYRSMGNEYQAQLLENQQAQIDQQIAVAQAALGMEVDDSQVEALVDEQVKNFGRDNMETIDGVTWTLTIVQMIGIILIMNAAKFWHNILRSRFLARSAWLVLLFVPMLIGLVPASVLVDFSQIDDPEMAKQMTMIMGLAFGLTYLSILGPKVIAIFPGTIRSAMALKVLLPESPAPGWLVAIFAPIYALSMFVITIFLNQIGANLGILVGMLCITAAPLIYIFRAKDVLRPHSAEELGPIVQQARLFSAIANLVGIVFIGTNILEMEELNLEPYQIISFFVGVLGSMWLLAVFSADLFLALFRTEYVQSKAFHATSLEKNLGEKFETLTAAGLTAMIGKKPIAVEQVLGEAQERHAPNPDAPKKDIY